MNPPTDTQAHYLKLTQKSAKRWLWECACGKAKGENRTEEACEYSHLRHLVGLTFRRRGL